MSYQYPLNSDWSKEEIIIVVKFFAIVEEAYEKGVNTDVFATHYRAFKQIVNSISEEKQIDKKFKENSGLSIYQVVKKWKSLDSGQKIVMK